MDYKDCENLDKLSTSQASTAVEANPTAAALGGATQGGRCVILCLATWHWWTLTGEAAAVVVEVCGGNPMVVFGVPPTRVVVEVVVVVGEPPLLALEAGMGLAGWPWGPHDCKAQPHIV